MDANAQTSAQYSHHSGFSSAWWAMPMVAQYSSALRFVTGSVQHVNVGVVTASCILHRVQFMTTEGHQRATISRGRTVLQHRQCKWRVGDGVDGPDCKGGPGSGNIHRKGKHSTIPQRHQPHELEGACKQDGSLSASDTETGCVAYSMATRSKT